VPLDSLARRKLAHRQTPEKRLGARGQPSSFASNG
jgi:hypothetical protein